MRTKGFTYTSILIVFIAAFFLAGCNLPLGAPTATPEPTATPTGPYMVEQLGPAETCGIFQRLELSVSSQAIHAGPDDNEAILGEMSIGNWIAATQRVGNWYQVSLPDTPVDGGWINRGGVMLEQPCSCYPNCARFVPQGPVNEITTCTLTLPAGTSYTVYYQPDTSSDVFATVSDGIEAMALARTTDDWIGFDPGVAQADNVGMDRLRWVSLPPDAIVLDGMACDALPVYEYQPVAP